MHIESRNKTENGEETYIKTIKVVSKFGRASVKQTTSDESLSNDGDGFIGLLPKKKKKKYIQITRNKRNLPFSLTFVSSFADESPILRRPLDGSSSSSSWTPLSSADGNGTAPTGTLTTTTSSVASHFDEGNRRLHDPAQSEVVYIKPTKIVTQLHANDLLYDSKTMTSGELEFRTMCDILWDFN